MMKVNAYTRFVKAPFGLGIYEFPDLGSKKLYHLDRGLPVLVLEEDTMVIDSTDGNLWAKVQIRENLISTTGYIVLYKLEAQTEIK